jgi:hypothetical protein
MDATFNAFSPLDCIVLVLILGLLLGPRLPGLLEDLQSAARGNVRPPYLPLMHLDRFELLLLWGIVAALLSLILLS